MNNQNNHAEYYVDNRRVPSVTQVINFNLGWNKDSLLKWTRKQALAGEDPDEIKGKASAIGTLVHGLIHQHITGEAFDTSQFAITERSIANKSFQAFLDWEKKVDLKPEAAELQLTHQELLYGGTIDLLATVNGVVSVVDFKTANSLWPEQRIQLAAYRELIHHNYGYYPETHLLHLSKEFRSFKHHHFKSLDREWEVFSHLLQLNNLYCMVK